MGLVGAFYGCLVTTKTVGDESCDAPDRGHTDTGEVVDLPVGEILLQVFNDLPSIDQRLKFGRRAQVLEEILTLLRGLEAVDGLKKGTFGIGLLAPCFIAVRFHGRTSVLTRYYTSTSDFEAQAPD